MTRRRQLLVTLIAPLTAVALLAGVPTANAAMRDSDGWPDATITVPTTSTVALDTPTTVTVTGTDLDDTVYVFVRQTTTDDPYEGPVVNTGTLTPSSPVLNLAIPTDKAGSRHYYVMVSSTPDDDGWMTEEQFDLTVIGHPSTITATFPDGTYRARAKIARTITGTVPGTPGRTVQIQSKGSNGSWVPLVTTKTRADGTFTAAVPTFWVATLTLRAYVTPTATQADAATTNTGTIRVTRTYKPRPGNRYVLNDKTAHWNPCKAITYRINPSRMWKGGAAQTKAALAQVTEATGLRFVYAGTTTFVPYRRMHADNPSNADLVIAWATPEQVSRLSGGVIGLGGAQWTSSGPGAELEYYEGSVVYDVTQRLGRTPAAHARGQLNLMLHEIGHAIGLDHTMDRRSTMYPSLVDVAPHYSNGDLRGLARLGAARGCIANAQR